MGLAAVSYQLKSARRLTAPPGFWQAAVSHKLKSSGKLTTSIGYLLKCGLFLDWKGEPQGNRVKKN